MIERKIEYTHEGTVLEGLLCHDGKAAGPRPAVLIAHAWAGRSGFEDEKARALAVVPCAVLPGHTPAIRLSGSDSTVTVWEAAERRLQAIGRPACLPASASSTRRAARRLDR